MNGCSRVKKFQHPVVDVTIHQQRHGGLALAPGVLQHLQKVMELLI